MNCSFGSSLSDAKPFLSRVRSHKPQGKPILTAFSCRAREKDQSTDFYKVLSLNSNQASIDEIKKAYGTMARQYHPDVRHPSKKDESTRMFVQLHAAYKTLSGPVLREEYDCRLSSRNLEGKFRADFPDHYSRIRWQEQIQELKRRSSYLMAQKERSWGSRMRAKSNEKKD
ncbi:chaperone protein dnaJ 20, chloroplastic-like [Herrania umbratica]|uniref:Chaperone protein dnaJ 20, chloroplastic-like n=1 Tax=Herrania umbratica TaxID=108875 RepID=A0A6J0ZTJ6_9ROSI|nr:chaperone protein dnaJ 20, chloroplastic-like [Herrania umbratica]